MSEFLIVRASNCYFQESIEYLQKHYPNKRFDILMTRDPQQKNRTEDSIDRVFKTKYERFSASDHSKELIKTLKEKEYERIYILISKSFSDYQNVIEYAQLIHPSEIRFIDSNFNEFEFSFLLQVQYWLKKVSSQFLTTLNQFTEFEINTHKNQIPWKSSKKLSYSQSGEDIVFDSLKNQPQTGFYVDVGAHHPIYHSNTYRLYKRGWEGINIDPLPSTKKLFDEMRPNDTNLQVAVSNQTSGNKPYYYMFKTPAYNTMKSELAKKRISEGIELLDKVEVEIITLKDIFKHYLPSKANVDLLNIDVEGLEQEVLDSNNWSDNRPKMILLEQLHFENIEGYLNSKLHKFCISINYELVSCAKDTLFYQNNEC
jgi:FkbM family methyltransferase